jgi:hypothetical protein
MLKVLGKFFLLLAGTCLFNNIIFSRFHLPYYWGNEAAFAKSTYLNQHRNEFNTLFVGSSKTYHQLNVAYFDSLTEGKTRSFNYGIEGIAAADIYYYMDHLVGEDTGDLKYVFLELYDISFMAPQILHTREQKFWFNFSSWLFTVKTISASNNPATEKCAGLSLNTVNFCECLMKFDLIKDVYRFKHQKPEQLLLGSAKTGYVSLENAVINREFIDAGRKHFLINDSLNNLVKNASITAFSKVGSEKLNVPHFEKLVALIEKMHAKGIKVTIVLGPRSYEMQYENTLPVFIKIDKSPKLNLASATVYPEFYDKRYSYDVAHLNQEGSMIYTRRIAEEFLNATFTK